MNYKIPEEVRSVTKQLEDAGFEAYLVGGCVRDLVLGREPKDWDIATDAVPHEVQKVFGEEQTVYENQFGTVLVKVKSDKRQEGRENLEAGRETVPMSHFPIRTVEVTTYRFEGKYSDQRHPDEVKVAETIEEDLSRRDFTINAMALKVTSDKGQGTREEGLSESATMSHVAVPMSLTDPYGGEDDLKKKIIRTVGNPHDRFSEDALRLMRAVRIATELDFQIEEETQVGIQKSARGLEVIAKERVRDELVKILMSSRAAQGIVMLEELELLRYVMPELREGINVGQNKHHIYTVFEHNVRALGYTAKENYSIEVRMASLLHDVGKPRVKKGDGSDSTFYNHDIVGAKMTLPMLDRLHFPKEFIEHVAHLVRYHLFYYNVGEVTAAGVRRFLARVGPEYIDDLMKVREADRIGSGVPKAVPYKMRHLMFMIEKVKRDPISPKMLALDGNDLMKILSITPGPKVGQILAILLEEVLDDPSRNDSGLLEARVKDLGVMTEKELIAYAKKAKEKKEEFEEGIEKEIKQKHHVQ